MPARPPEQERPILIVDDRAENLRVLQDALEEAGFSTLVALGGEAALTRARQQLPALILLDADMPGMSGLEVAAHLKADPATSAIPVVILGGDADPAQAGLALAAGASDCILRPVRMDALLRRIAGLLGERQTGARTALDAYGQASMAVNPASGRISWQTALARDLLERHFRLRIEFVPPIVRNWLRNELARLQNAPTEPIQPLGVAHASGRIVFRLHKQTGDGEWLLLLDQEHDETRIAALQARLSLDRTEAALLHWAARGKRLDDIAEMLDATPDALTATLETLCARLGVPDLDAALARAREQPPGSAASLRRDPDVA